MGGVQKTTNVIGNYVFPEIDVENEYIKSGGALHLKDSDGNVVAWLYFKEDPGHPYNRYVILEDKDGYIMPMGGPIP